MFSYMMQKNYSNPWLHYFMFYICTKSTTCTWKLIAWFFSWKWLKITINLKCKLASISMYTHTWHQIPLEKTHISYILLGFMPQAKKVILEKKKNCFCWGNPKPASHCHPNWSSHLSRLLPSIPGEKSTFQNWAWWIRNHRSFF